ncbi:MAG TPA: transcription-repair coupling factor [Firmicutes bacterium]|nr:transcription-repair coupling factor [Bacillota bacterium]
MALTGLSHLVSRSQEFAPVVDTVIRGAQETLVIGASGSLRIVGIAAIFQTLAQRGSKIPFLVVAPDQYHAEQIYLTLENILTSKRVALFPAISTMPHESVIAERELHGMRVAVIGRLLAEESLIVVASAEALSRYLLPPQVFRAYCTGLTVGETVELEQLMDRLVAGGYQRVDLVEDPGQFSLRGGILDIFCPILTNPVRIELFGDEIDSIREFDPADQRSYRRHQSVYITPAREFFVPEHLRKDAFIEIKKALEEQVVRLDRAKDSPSSTLRQTVARHLEFIENGIYDSALEQYQPYFYPNQATLLAYFPRMICILDEPSRIKESLENVEKEYMEQHLSGLAKGRALPGEARMFCPWSELFPEFKRGRLLYFSTLAQRIEGMSPTHTVNVSSRLPDVFHGKMNLLLQELERAKREGFAILLSLSSESRAKRITEWLTEEGVPARYVLRPEDEIRPGNIIITSGYLEAGFDLPLTRLLVLTDAEIRGKAKQKVRSRRGPQGTRIRDWNELNEGDYVVHVNHGIGKYLGVKNINVSGVQKDYLVVKYAGEDILYVPVDQVNLLQKYVGGGDEASPKLNKLGGTEWTKVKRKVKESVREIAKDLLELYAARETVPGRAFSPDTVWQREFEDAFEYEETPDQLRAVQEVKADMEKPRPMDRLLCGDVGYGKTEVALRAAFKAVMDGCQVAILVPTTILAQQHYRTVSERLRNFPVTVRVLSRFESPSKQKQTIKDLKTGAVDIVIGTHRLLSKDVEFKNLGLVIIDEEQRFGVKQKEKLKQLRTSVDVLTLSATPIPRTLHMALVGVRDMSVIETPPEDRYPIRTYIVEYNPETIRDAILREKARGGQVYFVYNRVQGIERMAEELRLLVPEVSVVVAHGQMGERELEQVMLDFMDGAYDVLVCTTIIETGMDIPNVNTLIVYDADKFGLSQLYQLRGRVGRSNRIAYAYCCYRKDQVLTEDAEKRLQAIKEFSDLGSGFRIAMRDLEIRGAGNILGAEQHGFIASVGFELYCRLLEESIAELSGQVKEELPEPLLDFAVDAYIDDEYIADSRQKVDIYKRISALGSQREIQEFVVELEDRYGPVTPSVDKLLRVAAIRIMAREVGVESIAQEARYVVFRFHPEAQVPPSALRACVEQFRGKLTVLHGQPPRIRIRPGLEQDELLDIITTVLKNIQASLAEASGQ